MTSETGSDERECLLSSLADQREHVLGILEGLADESLRRPVLPSGWTCAGLVRHLALDVERFWFRTVVAGESAVVDASAAGADSWRVPQEVSASAVFDLYRQEIELANRIIADRTWDAAPQWWPVERWPGWRMRTVREVIVHVITETACHAGHLDAACELIDGRTWTVITG